MRIWSPFLPCSCFCHFTEQPQNVKLQILSRPHTFWKYFSTHDGALIFTTLTLLLLNVTLRLLETTLIAHITSIFQCLPHIITAHNNWTLATALARSDAAWLFLMRISERESLPKQTTKHRRLESKHHRRNSGSAADVLARTFQNMARRVQSCLDANGDHFQHMLWCRHISYTMR